MAERPIFANYHGWVLELAEQEEVGAILPLHNHETAADILWGKLRFADWMDAAFVKARELAEKRFSFDILVGKMENILLSQNKQR